MTHTPARGGTDDRVGATPIHLSRAILAWERLERAFWKPAAVFLLFLTIAFSGFLPDLPFWLHGLVLLGFTGCLFWLIWRGFRRFRVPAERAARRRVEQVNDLPNRPLETLVDKPSTDDPVQLALWAEHRRRVMARLTELKIGGPKPQLAKLDPMALRIAAAFLLVIMIGAVGRDAPANLREALMPSLPDRAASLAAGVDAWLAPPDYTGLAPRFLSRSGQVQDLDIVESQTAPSGSLLIVQVTGEVEQALLITPDGPVEMALFATGGRAVEHKLTSSGEIAVEADGIRLAAWHVDVVPDQAPEVTLPELPVPSLHQALTITHTVSDDYAVTSLTAIIERADRPVGSAQSSPQGNEVMTIETPLPVPDAVQYGEVRTVYRDYTAHPWAGGEVRLTLVAMDALGQEGRSEPVTITLPAREFHHPVAQAIVELRRELAWDPGKNLRNVADALEALSWNHESFDDDVTVFLSLREATYKLRKIDRGGVPSFDAVDAVVEMLWKTALYLEDGGVSLALARLRAAEQALMEALANGADAQELDRLMDELQAAMDEYMQAMTDQLRQNLEDGNEIPELGPDQQIISSRDLDEMMDQIREMMQNGMTESATQMLEQLRRMMENMQAGMQTQMTGDSQEAMEMLEAMQDLMESQRELMDRTHERSQDGDGQSGQDQSGSHGDGQSQSDGGGEGRSGGPNSADAVLQEALRRQLGEIMRQFGEMMGEIPDSFGRAEEGMSESAERLGAGDPEEALGPQEQAMDGLQDAARDARNAFVERFDRQMGLGQNMPGQSGQQTMDPFGREPSNAVQGGTQGEVTVPEQGGLERSRQIRDELRRRSGQRSRPSEELEYFDRLLDQFR